jgi:hypothetical protein
MKSGQTGSLSNRRSHRLIRYISGPAPGEIRRDHLRATPGRGSRPLNSSAFQGALSRQQSVGRDEGLSVE